MVEIQCSPSFILSLRPDHAGGTLRTTEVGVAEAPTILASHVSERRDSSPRVRVKIHISHPTWDVDTRAIAKEEIGHRLELMFPLGSWFTDNRVGG